MSKIKKIYSTSGAFAAIGDKDNVITWGILIMVVILVMLKIN
jgi:hypothetical protein